MISRPPVQRVSSRRGACGPNASLRLNGFGLRLSLILEHRSVEPHDSPCGWSFGEGRAYFSDSSEKFGRSLSSLKNRSPYESELDEPPVRRVGESQNPSYCATLAGATTGVPAATGLANFARSMATFSCKSSRLNVDCPSVHVKRH